MLIYQLNFCKNFLRNIEYEYSFLINNSLIIYKIQSHYLNLFWNYSISKYGQYKTYQLFIKLITLLNKLQSFTKLFREFFLKQNQSTQMLQRLPPLMQSILNIN